MAQYREGGSFAVDPRAGGGGEVHVTVDARQVIQIANKIRGEAAKLSAAAKQANTQLAKELQEDIARVLMQKVERRGRQQRAKPENDRLAAAIRSPRNRTVNTGGYTVGHLDEIAAVRPYYRNLEVGTSIFVGRYLSGVFSDTYGGGEPGQQMKRGRPERGRYGSGAVERRTIGRDAYFVQRNQFRYEKPFVPGVRIKRPIVGYEYFYGGLRNFEERGGTRELARAAYAQAFRDFDLGELSRASGGIPNVTNYDSGIDYGF